MRLISATWGALGVASLLVFAITRMTPHALKAINDGLSTSQWVILVVFALFMLFAEGYRGFHQKFSPRTAARVHYLYNHNTPLRAIFAPFFCMGFFHANKKTRIVATILKLGIIGLIILMKYCPQPWRGIIDVGVILGLSAGLLSFIYFTFKVFQNKDHGISPEMP